MNFTQTAIGYAEKCGRQSASITIARIWAQSVLSNFDRPEIAHRLLTETIEKLIAAEAEQ